MSGLKILLDGAGGPAVSASHSTNPTAERIAARLTPGGRGAVGTIGLLGHCSALDTDPPLFSAANCRPLAAQDVGRMIFGRWGRHAQEEVVVCRVDRNRVEVHCHGGEAAVSRILDEVSSRGWRIVDGFDFLRMTEGLFAAELAAALSRATTARTAELLLAQSTTLPAAISKINQLPPEDAVRGIDELLRWSRFGRHLTEPWSVVLAGRPNVGKSSLINALVGYGRSIVYDEPGTTRDVVTADTAFDGWPLRFADTAGIRNEADELESAGIARSLVQIRRADMVLLLLDIGQRPTEADIAMARQIPGELDEVSAFCVVAHKCDLPDAWGSQLPQDSLRVASRTGEGVSELLGRVVSTLVPEVPDKWQAIPFTDRHVRLLAEARDALMAGRSAAVEWHSAS